MVLPRCRGSSISSTRNTDNPDNMKSTKGTKVLRHARITAVTMDVHPQHRSRKAFRWAGHLVDYSSSRPGTLMSFERPFEHRLNILEGAADARRAHPFDIHEGFFTWQAWTSVVWARIVMARRWKLSHSHSRSLPGVDAEWQMMSSHRARHSAKEDHATGWTRGASDRWIRERKQVTWTSSRFINKGLWVQVPAPSLSTFTPR